MSDLIVKATAKSALSDHNVSANFYNTLNEDVSELLDDTEEHAEANNQKTVQPRATCSLWHDFSENSQFLNSARTPLKSRGTRKQKQLKLEKHRRYRM